jgi:GH25 family lysozyme M1 (1,4-beta-N-acetylmuramidase)
MTIFGCDFSDYDWDRGSMNMSAMRADGISFVTHKLTELAGNGAVFYHSNIKEFWNRSLKAGFPFIGCYVVVRSDVSVAQQVATALRYVNHTWLDFPGFFWQVDTERWPYDSVKLSQGTEMCRQLEAVTGKQAVHYASVGQYGLSWHQPYPRWNARYPLWDNGTATSYRAHYRAAYNMAGGDRGSGWLDSTKIWQYTDNGIVGKQVRVDCNAYKGTEADFGKMIGAHEFAPPASVSSTTNSISVWMG